MADNGTQSGSMASGTQSGPGWLKTLGPSAVSTAGKIIGVGLLVMTLFRGCAIWEAHQYADQQYVKQTQVAIRTLTEAYAKQAKETKALQVKLRKARQYTIVLKQREDSILRAHPIATAPAVCAPWTDALTLCRARGDSLEHVANSADSALTQVQQQADGLATSLSRADTALSKSVAAGRKAKWQGRLEGGIIGAIIALILGHK